MIKVEPRSATIVRELRELPQQQPVNQMSQHSLLACLLFTSFCFRTYYFHAYWQHSLLGGSWGFNDPS